MSETRNAGFPRGIDDEGSVVAGTPRRQLSPVRKVAVAGLVLVVLLAFIWINQLNKATQQVKQPDMAFSPGGEFHAPPSGSGAICWSHYPARCLVSRGRGDGRVPGFG